MPTPAETATAATMVPTEARVGQHGAHRRRGRGWRIHVRQLDPAAGGPEYACGRASRAIAGRPEQSKQNRRRQTDAAGPVGTHCRQRGPLGRADGDLPLSSDGPILFAETHAYGEAIVTRRSIEGGLPLTASETCLQEGSTRGRGNAPTPGRLMGELPKHDVLTYTIMKL